MVLAVLTVAFFGRVAGQLLVAVLGVGFLPPMEAWDSGLLEYSLLVVAQVAILAFQAAVVLQLWAGRGGLIGLRPRLGTGLERFSIIYFAIMFARWVVSVWVPVELPWSPAVIPIYFHWVLALWVYWLSRHYRGLRPLPWSRSAGARAG